MVGVVEEHHGFCFPSQPFQINMIIHFACQCQACKMGFQLCFYLVSFVVQIHPVGSGIQWDQSSFGVPYITYPAHHTLPLDEVMLGITVAAKHQQRTGVVGVPVHQCIVNQCVLIDLLLAQGSVVLHRALAVGIVNVVRKRLQLSGIRMRVRKRKRMRMRERERERERKRKRERMRMRMRMRMRENNGECSLNCVTVINPAFKVNK